MISVDEALARLFALAPVLPPETVPLGRARGRVLVQDVEAARAQPPFDASAMDGYAVAGGPPAAGAVFTVLGEAAAGHGYAGRVGPGQAVRIFTGAPLPPGATRVVIQEDAERDGDRITIREGAETGAYVRPRGADFDLGARLAAPRRLTPADVALAAAMGAPEVAVARRPRVALIATGDELAMPAPDLAEDRVVASNGFGLAALAQEEGAEARLLPIARDNRDSLRSVLALAEGADLIVTIGGASVGDHDLVGEVAAEAGLDRAFWKIAMRPGKPLMAGRLGSSVLVGLPGNPVSAMVCGHVFLRPLLRAMQGLTPRPLDTVALPLAEPVGANGARAHYMRARRRDGAVAVAERQDSALLTVLADADCLVLRPPGDPARDRGAMVPVIPF